MKTIPTIVLAMTVLAAIAYLVWEQGHRNAPGGVTLPSGASAAAGGSGSLDPLDAPVSASALPGGMMGPSRDANQAWFYPPPLQAMLPVSP